MSARRAAMFVALVAATTFGFACSSDESSDSDDTSKDTAAIVPDTTDDTEATTDTAEPAATTTVAGASEELSAETCALLTELHEFNDGFNAAAISRDFDRLQAFDAENAPRALEIYDELSTTLAGSETDIAQARQLTEGLSGVVAGASSIDEVTSEMFALPDLNAANESLVAIDDLAVERCAPE